MPAKQRGRRNHKRAPARSWQEPAGGSEKDSISRPKLKPSGLPAQHRQLATEHHDLQLLELLRAKTQRRELQHTPKHDIAERPEQRQCSFKTTARVTRLYGAEGQDRVNAPHTVGGAPEDSL